MKSLLCQAQHLELSKDVGIVAISHLVGAVHCGNITPCLGCLSKDVGIVAISHPVYAFICGYHNRHK